MIERTCRVEVQRDYLSKVAQASPERALAELIWNALDADATYVEVFFTEGELGTFEVIIKDNGVGFSIKDAESLFTALGGSWKSHKDKTSEGRLLHGKEGQGRFKAFALCRSVEWDVVAKLPNGDVEAPFKIVALADRLEEFSIEDSATDSRTTHGVTVRLSEPLKEFSVFNPEIAAYKLLPIFALYLHTYRRVTLMIGGERLDAATAIRHVETVSLSPITYNDIEYPVILEIVEWRDGGDRELWLCTENSFPLDKYPRQIRGVGDFGFSGYLKSELISVLSNDGTLGLGELNTHLRDASENAIREIKSHFASRLVEESQEKIRKWKEDNIYPFPEKAASPVEVAERQVFDVVATKVAESLPSFDEADKKSKAFQLRMLRHALERGPEELQTVITEVLKLPKKDLDQLSELLRDVSLAGVINASKLVTDRLKLITGLELLLFDTDSKKTLKERSQLHKIVAENTWLFGQEFSISVNDRSLTEVLRKHREILGTEIPIDEPVTRIDGTVGIVDLMLSRSIPCNREDEVEHLVVELKAPKVKIGEKECSQIENYAFAVIEDDRFASLSTKWDFWIISNEMDSYTQRKANQDGRPKGVLFRDTKDADVTIWVKTWSQIIRENKYRLEFVREKLNYEIDQNDALQHLRDTYSQFTKGVVIDGEQVSENDDAKHRDEPDT
ncbi:MAG: ATP-binding protein [Gammaproteobacteria bacterium]|nr:ATP-binding protein [Gammaproteobacteria bacterium]